MESSKGAPKTFEKNLAVIQSFAWVFPALFFFFPFISMYFYFHSLGISTYKVPLSVTDYWLTTYSISQLFAFVLPLTCFVFDLYVPRSKRDPQSEKENRTQTKCNAMMGKIIAMMEGIVKYLSNNLLKKWYFILILLVAARILLLWESFFYSEYFFLIMSSYVVVSVFISVYICKRYDMHAVLFIAVLYIINCMIPLLFCSARTSAIDDYCSKSSSIIVENKSYYNIRSFEKGFLLREEGTGNIVFLTESNKVIVDLGKPIDLIQYLNKKAQLAPCHVTNQKRNYRYVLNRGGASRCVPALMGSVCH